MNKERTQKIIVVICIFLHYLQIKTTSWAWNNFENLIFPPFLRKFLFCILSKKQKKKLTKLYLGRPLLCIQHQNFKKMTISLIVLVLPDYNRLGLECTLKFMILLWLILLTPVTIAYSVIRNWFLYEKELFYVLLQAVIALFCFHYGRSKNVIFNFKINYELQ